MNSAKKIALGVLLLAATSFAAAQERTVKFTLAKDTYLGSSLLTAGAYRMSVMSGSQTIALVTNEGTRKNAVMVVPTSHEYSACDKSSMTVTPSAGQTSLTSVCFADSYLTLYFPVITKTTKTISAISTPEGK